MAVDKRFVRQVEDVVEALKGANGNQKKCTLLVGAGCSFSAGIPLAGGIVKDIKDRHGRAYGHACADCGSPAPSYADCMGALNTGQRRDLIAGYVRNARLNWAHVAVATLMQAGYVDRVMTTNFDNLVVRACALLHEFPAVYDLAASHEPIRFGDLPDKAVFYLHGQSTGFQLKNLTGELEEQAPYLQPCFNFEEGGRVWIVVGYSGENDPIFNQFFGKAHNFPHGLYWVQYRDQEPVPAVCDALFQPGKDAYLIQGHDADEFFIALARQLGCFPPSFIGKPLTYLESLLSHLTDFPVGDKGGAFDVLAEARRVIRKAAAEGETDPTPNTTKWPWKPRVALDASALLAKGEYKQVIKLWHQADQTTRKCLGSAANAAFKGEAYKVGIQADEATGAEALALRKQEEQFYREAIKIKPDDPNALTNLGAVLSQQANEATGAAKLDLLKQAEQFHREAIKVKPDDAGALTNLGVVLERRSDEATGAAKLDLLKQAEQFYREAIKIKPDYAIALTNLGVVLERRSDEATGAAKLDLLKQAEQFHREVVKIKPDDTNALYNLGTVLMKQASSVSEDVAASLLREGIEVCRKVEAIEPGRGTYNLACAFALQGKPDECRDWLLKALEQGKLPPRSHLESDSDMDSVRGLDWFAEILAQAKP